MNLTKVADDYEQMSDRCQQETLLAKAAAVWPTRAAEYAAWARGCVREGHHSIFLCDLFWRLHQPDVSLRDFCLDHVLQTLQREHRCDTHTYLMLHGARALTTDNDFWETLLHRGATCAPERVEVMARLFGSQDRWGYNPPVDIRLRWTQRLQSRFLQTDDAELETALIDFLPLDPRTDPAVGDKAEQHSSTYIRARAAVWQNVPPRFWPHWYRHFYGHEASLTSLELDPLKLEETDFEWLFSALEHPRLVFFATFLLQQAEEMKFPDGAFARFRRAYLCARRAGGWCYFGSQTGNWNARSWAEFLARRFDSSEVTSTLMEAPVSWDEMALMPRHQWCREEFGPVDRWKSLLNMVGARGVALYQIEEGELKWSGFVGDTWLGPPLGASRFLHADRGNVVTLAPSHSEESLGSEELSEAHIIHLTLSDRNQGLFLYRWLRPDSSCQPFGRFTEREFEQAKTFRDNLFGIPTA
jgi:hypothetical protein